MGHTFVDPGKVRHHGQAVSFVYLGMSHRILSAQLAKWFPCFPLWIGSDNVNHFPCWEGTSHGVQAAPIPVAVDTMLTPHND